MCGSITKARSDDSAAFRPRPRRETFTRRPSRSRRQGDSSLNGISMAVMRSLKKSWTGILPRSLDGRSAMRSGSRRSGRRLSGARLNALTPTALESARAQLTEGRTPQTVNRYMGFLRRVLNKAVRDGKLASNPVSRVKMFREPAGNTRFLSPEEEARPARRSEHHTAGWIRLAILTGMRQMEQFSSDGNMSIWSVAS